MAVRPITPPVPGRSGSGGGPPGAGGNLRRNPSRAPSNLRPVVPGSVRPGNPTPPPPTPFQPGAPPSPPLPIPGALIGGLLLGGQVLWGWLNQKEQQPKPPTFPELGDADLTFSAPRTVRVNTSWQITGPLTDCNTLSLRTVNIGPVPNSASLGGVSGVRIRGVQPRTNTGACPGPVRISGAFGSVEFLNASGAVIGGLAPLFSGNISGGSESGSLTLDLTAELTDLGTGQPIRPPAPARPPLLPQVAPQLPEELPQTEPEQQPAAPPVVPLPVAPPVPGVAPAFPRPAPTPGGAPGRAPGRAPGVAPSPGPWPGPSRPPALPQAVPITAGGVQPQLPPAPAPTNTGATFLPGGRPLAPNGPQPTIQGIATELGKLEQKLEIVLNPNDPLSPLELLNKVIDQIENIEFLIERLFPPEPYTFSPGAYELAPICDRNSEGELIEPLKAPWTGGEGELTELRRKLDALALLIQHHKTLKQPTCGGRGSGPSSNVTVRFESD